MSQAIVGRRYAAALLAEAADEAAAREFGDELAAAAETFADPLAAKALAAPGIPLADRAGVLEALTDALGVSKVTKRFLGVLFDADRIGALGAVRDAYQTLFEERFAVRTALVETASPLGDEESKTLTTKLEALTGGRVELEVREVPELLAGWRARVGNQLIEADLAGQAARLATRVVKG